MKKTLYFLLTISLALLTLSCRTENQTSGGPVSLKETAVQFPGKVISTRANITVTFSKPIVDESFAGTGISVNPFEFTPEIKGSAVWVSASSVEFRPSSPLKSGQKYSAVLHGDKLLGKQRCTDSVTFDFTAAPQEIISCSYDFEPVPGKKNTLRIKTQFEFAEAVKPEQLKEDLSIKGSRKLTLSCTKGESARHVTVTSEELVRGEAAQQFTLHLPKKYTADQTEWKETVIVPEASVFAVLYHADNSDREQGTVSYAFNFSDPIRKDIDLSGFISCSLGDCKVKVKNRQLVLEGDFEAGIPYTVTIAKGFPSQYGTVTASEQQYQIIFDNEKPRIEWLSPGSMISSENKSKLQFKSINVKTVNLQVYEVFRENLGFFLQNNGLEDISGSSDGYDDEEYYYGGSGFSDLERVGEVIITKDIKIDEKKNHWCRSELDLSKLFKSRPGSAYIVTLTFNGSMLTGRPISSMNDYSSSEPMLFYGEDNYYTNPTSDGYYYRYGNTQKLLIASDVGLTAKEHDAGYTVFAVNVNTASPEAGMKVGLYSYQNRKLAEGTTDNNGAVDLKIDSGKTASYILGEGKSGLAVMKLAGGEWNMSTFDVEGNESVSSGTEMFLYADRGVHRPGDTVFLSGILRLNRKFPPKNLPVTLTVTNSMGNVVFTEKSTGAVQGHFSWTIPTLSSDPTGNWEAVVTVGDNSFSQTLPIETVKPNRLKVTHTIPASVQGSSVAGTITTRYLFGAPAANLAASLFATVTETPFTPKQFPDFTFESPVREYSERGFTLFEGVLDDNGNCSFREAVESAERAPSILRSSFSLRVEEKGGSVVEKRFSSTIYPYSHYVGIMDPFRWGSAPIGTKSSIPLVSVDPSGKAAAGHKLSAKLYINKRHWWWDYDKRDRQDFRTMDQTYLVSEQMLVSGSKPVEYRFAPEDDGQYYLSVTDLTSGHETGLFFYASRWAGEGRTGRGEETYLPVEIRRGMYNPGETAEISCEAPDSAMAILTIEQNRKIISRHWGKAKNGRVSFSVPVTAEMMPNCYAVMQLIQPHRRTNNDMPHSLFGVKPFTVEEKSTRLGLTLNAPEEVRPEQKFTITVGNDSKEKVTATIAVVDEGLLDLTDYKTPSPWDHFFRKLRLAVTTRDNFRCFLNALLTDMDQLFSIGGDDDESSRKDRLGSAESKRFKPVVLFTKPVTIGGKGKKQITLTMPNYIGEVRVMVVGAGQNSFGSVSKPIAVRQPVMVLPTLPRTVRPGDQFEIPVSVFAMKPFVKQAVVTVVSKGGVSIPVNRQSISFAKPGEKDISFAASAGNRLGNDTIIVTAVSGKEKSTAVVVLPIQSANPFYTEVTDTILAKDLPVTFTPAVFGYRGTNRVKLTLSRTADIQLEKRVGDLIQYPYGCIEQTTSALLPQLVLDKVVELSPLRKKMITGNLNAGIARLRSFRDGSSFSYWPVSQDYGSYRSDWGGVYACHFLALAKKAGYAVPADQVDHWKNYAAEQAKLIRSDFRTQCYALFVLALDGSPLMGNMNLLKENYGASLDGLSRELLATAYVLAGKADAGKELLKTPSSILSSRELDLTFGSPARDLAMYTYLASIRGNQNRAVKMMAELAKQFRPGSWSSTHETGLAVIAAAQYSAKFGKASNYAECDVSFNGKTQRIKLQGLQKQIDIPAGTSVKVLSRSGSPVFASLAVSGVPMQDRITSAAQGIQMDRKLYTEEGYLITADELKQSKPVWIVMNVNSQWGSQLSQLALSMVLPAGWEIVNTRLNGEPYPAWLGSVSDGTYTDIRDDRINWFFNLSSYSSEKFAVKIIPSFTGTYTLPPVVVETMYSPDYYARIAGGITKVVGK